jgi:hypothetical protein
MKRVILGLALAALTVTANAAQVGQVGRWEIFEGPNSCAMVTGTNNGYTFGVEVSKVEGVDTILFGGFELEPREQVTLNFRSDRGAGSALTGIYENGYVRFPVPNIVLKEISEANAIYVDDLAVFSLQHSSDALNETTLCVYPED